MRRARSAVFFGALTALLIGRAPADPPDLHAQLMHQLPATVAEWAQGARLFPGLGEFHRAVNTSVPLAQQYFDQGMRLAWAFNHDEAARSFAEGARLDPQCAGCYWGLALTVGPNYNMTSIDAVRAQVAYQALQLAQAQAVHASAVEQALIGALAARYPSAQPPAGRDEGRAILEAYAAAMREVAAHFPQDLDVQTLCAEAEMTVHAWKLWSAAGVPAPGTLDAKARLEAVLAAAPDHPGANHYYVHLMEASPEPGKAAASAERLRGMMPAAGHLEHMPAHIMQRLGRYEEAAEANRRGVAADQAYLAGTTPPGVYVMYLGHNYAFLAYAAAMEGRKAETLAAVQGLSAVRPVDLMLGMGDLGWGLTAQYAALVRFGLWDELLALGPPDPRASGLTAGYLYGRGVALAARGQLAEARGTLTQLQALDSAAGDTRADVSSLHEIIAVAAPVVQARIAASEGHSADAVSFLEQAVAAEDRLGYDEPAQWFFPARHLLGAQLLIAGRAAEAEAVYREDLRRNPANGWSLYGLAAALEAEGHSAAAARTGRAFQSAWQHADVQLPASAFWFSGADTFSCECQRENSGKR
jgi:tetratricopeptide (TPR) repeat protein